MTKNTSESVEAYWRRCRTVHRIARDSYHAGPFSDPRLAPYQDMLLDLVAGGNKRATARLDMEFDRCGISRRRAGDYWVVLSAEATPRFLIRLTDVEVKPFDQVDGRFAAREGEGNGSLDHWRTVHREYFVQQCAEWGVAWRENLLVCCEGFEVVADKA